MRKGDVYRAMVALRDALRESERKREELEAVLRDFLQGSHPKLADKIAPHWVTARVTAVRTDSEAYGQISWTADLQGDGPIPPDVWTAFQSPGGVVKMATRVPRAIISVGGKVLSEVEDFRIE